MAKPLLGRSCAVFGFANHRSLAWGVGQAWHEAGADVTFGIADDRFGPALLRLTESWAKQPTIVTANVENEASLDAAFEAVRYANEGRLHALLHAVAFAPATALKSPMIQCTKHDFAVAHDVSSYSLIALARRALPLMEAIGSGGSISALSFAGSARAAAGYGIMGPAKASLEAVARGLAAELGPKSIRVNVISPGPVDTLAARGLPGFTALRDRVVAASPLGRQVTPADVGALATFLASDASSSITGQTLYIDGGHSVVLA